jgi:hypothetical protein
MPPVLFGSLLIVASLGPRELLPAHVLRRAGASRGFTTHTQERVIYARSSVSSAPPARPRLAFRLSRRF